MESKTSCVEFGASGSVFPRVSVLYSLCALPEVPQAPSDPEPHRFNLRRIQSLGIQKNPNKGREAIARWPTTKQHCWSGSVRHTTVGIRKRRIHLCPPLRGVVAVRGPQALNLPCSQPRHALARIFNEQRSYCWSYRAF